MNQHSFCVIIAGGQGTRFWPLSRSERPKQLLSILSAKTLIRETVERLLPLCKNQKMLVVTVAKQVRALKQELPGIPADNFLTEPQGRNTAPCIGLAALEILTRDPDGIMLVFPADHWVTDVGGFRRTLRAAAELAHKTDNLITVGIRPEYPETGYGYIMKGKPVGKIAGAPAYQVKRFREKPSLAIARQWVRRGSLWNSGIFVWKASTLLTLLGRYHPEILARLAKISSAANGRRLGKPSASLRRVMTREYRKMPNISIDFAVLENAGSENRVITVEASFGWSDVGSWAAVHRMMHHDQNGNAGTGKWLGLEAKNCLIHAPDRLVVLLGIKGAVVVDTPDALLVGDLTRAQEVRELVEQLQRSGYGAYTVK